MTSPTRIESPVYAILQMNRVLSSMPLPDGYGLESLNTQLPFDSSKILEGKSTVDESMVTGEPIPVEKTSGTKVTGGTVNATGQFIMQAERVGSDTLLAQIVRMVSEAQRSRAPIQRLADTVSAWFVPIVIVIAVLTFVVSGQSLGWPTRS